MLAPFAAAVALVAAWHYRTITPLLALMAGGLLTAAVWLPMGPEQRFVHVERDFTAAEAIPANNPIPLDRLLAPPVVHDIARDNNNMGDRVGLPQTLLLLLGAPAAVVGWMRGRRRLALALVASTLAGLLIFWLLTSASDPVWRLPVIGSLLARLLYRTRLMGVQTLAAAGAAGLTVALLSQRWQRVAGPTLAGLLILVALPSLYVELQHRFAPFGTTLSLAEVRAGEITSGGSALDRVR